MVSCLHGECFSQSYRSSCAIATKTRLGTPAADAKLHASEPFAQVTSSRCDAATMWRTTPVRGAPVPRRSSS